MGAMSKYEAMELKEFRLLFFRSPNAKKDKWEVEFYFAPAAYMPRGKLIFDGRAVYKRRLLLVALAMVALYLSSGICLYLMGPDPRFFILPATATLIPLLLAPRRGRHLRRLEESPLPRMTSYVYLTTLQNMSDSGPEGEQYRHDYLEAILENFGAFTVEANELEDPLRRVLLLEYMKEVLAQDARTIYQEVANHEDR